MFTVQSTRIGSLDRDACEAIVTLFPTGPGRWHISTEHRSVCDSPVVAHRADAVGEDDAAEKYEHARELARKWVASKRIPW